jgi:hypothetical protein
MKFILTVSRNIRFITIHSVPTRGIKKDVLPSLKRVVLLYKARGFRVKMMHGDDEFTSLRDPLLEMDDIQLNIAAAKEHVPEAERVIRTVKERNRATVSSLPFEHYPRVLKGAIVAGAATALNMFPHPDGVSDLMSPRDIVTGVKSDYKTHCRVVLIGTYCEVHDENSPTNTEAPRTSSAIALYPTGNLQGSYHFMALDTGQVISRRRWTELPMKKEVITRVHKLALAEKGKAPVGVTPPFQYAWGQNDPVYDAHDDHGRADGDDIVWNNQAFVPQQFDPLVGIDGYFPNIGNDPAQDEDNAPTAF